MSKYFHTVPSAIPTDETVSRDAGMTCHQRPTSQLLYVLGLWAIPSMYIFTDVC